jgi:hypothetical protein
MVVVNNFKLLHTLCEVSLERPSAASVREATRFKVMRDTVDGPYRNQQVIDGAVANM